MVAREAGARVGVGDASSEFGGQIKSPGVGSPFAGSRLPVHPSKKSASVSPVDSSAQAAAHANTMNQASHETNLRIHEHKEKLAATDEFNDRELGRQILGNAIGKLTFHDLNDAMDAHEMAIHLRQGNMQLAAAHANRYNNSLALRQQAQASKQQGVASGSQLEGAVEDVAPVAPPAPAEPAAPAAPAETPQGTPEAATPSAPAEAPAEAKPGFTPVPGSRSEDQAAPGVSERESSDVGAEPPENPPEAAQPTTNVPEATENVTKDTDTPVEDKPAVQEAEAATPTPPEPATPPNNNAGNPGTQAPTPTTGGAAISDAVKPESAVEITQPNAITPTMPGSPAAANLVGQAGTTDQDGKPVGRFGRGLRAGAKKIIGPPDSANRDWGLKGGTWVHHPDSIPGKPLPAGHKDAETYNRMLANSGNAEAVPDTSTEGWAPFPNVRQNAQPLPPAGSGRSRNSEMAQGAGNHSHLLSDVATVAASTAGGAARGVAKARAVELGTAAVAPEAEPVVMGGAALAGAGRGLASGFAQVAAHHLKNKE